MNQFPEIGKPNTTPLPGNVLWDHPRVEAAHLELYAAALAYAEEKGKSAADSSYSSWSEVCCRLENAAIAFGNAVREYTVPLK